MNPWILIPVTGAVMYGLWLLMSFTLHQIDNYHAAWREERLRAADPRISGGEQAEGKVI
jgi:hypothetical protein